MKPLALLASFAALVGVAVVALWPGAPPAHAQEQHALYISGLHIGKGNQAIVRLTNVSANGNDQYSVGFSVLETSQGRQINSFVDNERPLFQGDILQLDIGALVAAHQASLGENGNPDFKGPVQLVLTGNGGDTSPFGPDVISAQAFQKEGKARYRPHLVWQRR